MKKLFTRAAVALAAAGLSYVALKDSPEEIAARDQKIATELLGALDEFETAAYPALDEFETAAYPALEAINGRIDNTEENNAGQILLANRALEVIRQIKEQDKITAMIIDDLDLPEDTSPEEAFKALEEHARSILIDINDTKAPATPEAAPAPSGP